MESKYYTYLIVEIRAKSVGFALRQKEPKSLAPNQIAYRLAVGIDHERWTKRIYEANLGKIEPPEKPPAYKMEGPTVGDTTTQAVLKRMTGK